MSREATAGDLQVTCECNETIKIPTRDAHRHGRSPALCALGRKGTPRASLEKNIEALLAWAPPSGSTTLNNDANAEEGHLPNPAASPALSRRLRSMFHTPEGRGGKEGRGNSPLCWALHAARGGIEVCCSFRVWSAIQ